MRSPWKTQHSEGSGHNWQDLGAESDGSVVWTLRNYKKTRTGNKQPGSNNQHAKNLVHISQSSGLMILHYAKTCGIYTIYHYQYKWLLFPSSSKCAGYMTRKKWGRDLAWIQPCSSYIIYSTIALMPTQLHLDIVGPSRKSSYLLINLNNYQVKPFLLN